MLPEHKIVQLFKGKNRTDANEAAIARTILIAKLIASVHLCVHALETLFLRAYCLFN